MAIPSRASFPCIVMLHLIFEVYAPSLFPRGLGVGRHGVTDVVEGLESPGPVEPGHLAEPWNYFSVLTAAVSQPRSQNLRVQEI